jgi:hypothetical protein
LARHTVVALHVPLVQVLLQQSRSLVQAAPLAAQSAHAPSTHDPEQHCASCAHPLVSGAQVAGEHALSLQIPEQH